jgi:glyoxylase-like metal-dependent hydrolase (beta-lactamase superfamily II)
MIKVLRGADEGRYPHGHSLLVQGTSATVLIDPSLSVADGLTEPIDPSRVDAVLISHCHEDHIAGLFRFAPAPVHVHSADRLGLEHIDGLMRIYGMPATIEAAWRHEVLDRFYYAPRPDALIYEDGHTFDLGRTTVRAVHLPGHTRGHSGFLVEPDGVMFLADVDLTGFGPYYGDAWSSLDDFERTIQRCREIDAGTYATFHHKGVIGSRAEVLPLLDAYQSVIERRERAMLDFLVEPRTLDDMVAHRFIYRPHVQLLFADAVERRSAQLHLERLLTRGLVTQPSPDHYLAVARRFAQ